MKLAGTCVISKTPGSIAGRFLLLIPPCRTHNYRDTHRRSEQTSKKCGMFLLLLALLSESLLEPEHVFASVLLNLGILRGGDVRGALGYVGDGRSDEAEEQATCEAAVR